MVHIKTNKQKTLRNTLKKKNNYGIFQTIFSHLAQLTHFADEETEAQKAHCFTLNFTACLVGS